MRMSFDDGARCILRQLRDADREPRAGGGAAGAGRQQTALRCGSGRAHARAVSGQPRLCRSATRRGLPPSSGWRLPLPDHPYGRPANGTPESVAKIARADLADFQGAHLCQGHAARGGRRRHRCAKPSATMLDGIFGALPAKAKLTPVTNAEPKAAQKLTVVDMNVPQSVARFGLPAMARAGQGFHDRLRAQQYRRRRLCFAALCRGAREARASPTAWIRPSCP